MVCERGVEEGLKEIDRQQTTDCRTTKTKGTVVGMAVAFGTGVTLGRKHLQK